MAEVADGMKMPAWVVGGFVRDLCLSKPGKDIDIVVLGDSMAYAHALADAFAKNGKKPAVNVFKNFGTAQLKQGPWQIELIGARRESYDAGSRKPAVIAGSLIDDQLRRDFTINAMYMGLNQENFGELSDPFRGLDDLKEGLIRTPTDPDVTFSDDPLRMMRAIRFATRLGFRIEEDTYRAMKDNAHRLDIVSQERVSDELNGIILCDRPGPGFIQMDETGLLERFFPEMTALKGVEKREGKAHKDNFYHTLQVLDNLSQWTGSLWLRWAAILHDIAKPATKRFEAGTGWTFHGHEDRGSRMVKPLFKRLKLPLDEKMRYVEKLVLLHLRPIVLSQEIVTDSAIRRLIVDAGEDVEDLLLLCKADITSKNEVKVKKYLANLEIVRQKIKDVTERDHLRNWQPPVTGFNIKEIFRIKDPKKIGELKNYIREAILEGEIPNELEPALEYMRVKGLEMGLELS